VGKSSFKGGIKYVLGYYDYRIFREYRSRRNRESGRGQKEGQGRMLGLSV
jgi:hypothetical protein